MRSMTGFGRAWRDDVRGRVTVEVRTVNHRHLDLRVRGLEALGLEDAVSERIRRRIARGAVAVSVQVTRDAGPAGAPRVDVARAVAAHRALAALAETLGLDGPDLALVVAQPGVVRVDEPEASAPAAALVMALLDEALDAVDASRAQEGQALARDLHARHAVVTDALADVAQVAASLPAAFAIKLAARVQAAVGDAIDPGRLAQEAALLAERADVSEELARADAHLTAMAALWADAQPLGRRLDFLLTELGRECNTIGSKAGAVEIASRMIDIKSELEKLREQAQNVE